MATRIRAVTTFGLVMEHGASKSTTTALSQILKNLKSSFLIEEKRRLIFVLSTVSLPTAPLEVNIRRYKIPPRNKSSV